MNNIFNKFTKLSRISPDETFEEENEKTQESEIGQTKEKKDWLDENIEGQLSLDVYSTKDEIVVKSTIAGVKSEDIDISVNNDMLTIRGERKQETQEGAEDYYYQECYWGSFSRSIILPVEVDTEKISADLKNGVLTVRLPKIQKSKNIKIKVGEG